jgi:hypothetical protein
VGGALLGQHVHDVLEVLEVPALVGGDGDPVRILLDGGADDIGDAAVMAEMDDLDASVLDEASNNDATVTNLSGEWLTALSPDAASVLAWIANSLPSTCVDRTNSPK